MAEYPPTILLRHQRENLKKCSLRGLEGRSDCLFLTYLRNPLPDLSQYVVLKIGAPPLRVEDQHRGLLLLDGTWRLVQKMEKILPQTLEARGLPDSFRTVYPRRQTDCPNPEQGLSSLEALFLAYKILRRPNQDLLTTYHWKEEFLRLNQLG